jgi:hypothetical protein
MNKRIRENNNNEHLNTINKHAKTVTEFDYDDTLKEYSTLNKYPHEITRKHMTELFPSYKYKVNHTYSYDPHINFAGQCGLAYLGCKIKNEHIIKSYCYDCFNNCLRTEHGQTYDVAWNSVTDNITQREHNIFYKGDGYFNFVVHGGTYSKISYNDVCIDMIKNQDNDFIMPDMIYTYDTPIFVRDDIPVTVYTDGNTMTYNVIFTCSPFCKKLNTLKHITP